ncbi:hypothetical protein B0H15DRAFT_800581 [Mycena belliarum]|uniref:Uncharacterized protein n=1 Tax=Mycena belliarum TaxID=1033014 RepID=A0AAD6U436_9AGAR|nr:hypothetical protein B0H15DRAFT_800581 [Mycena belliae]
MCLSLPRPSSLLALDFYPRRQPSAISALHRTLRSAGPSTEPWTSTTTVASREGHPRTRFCLALTVRYGSISVHILTLLFEHDQWFFNLEDRSMLLQCRSSWNDSTSLNDSYCLFALPLLDERLDLFGGILLSRYAAAPQKLGFGAVLNRSGCVQVVQLLHYRGFDFIISTWLKGETTLVYAGIQEYIVKPWLFAQSDA